MFEVAEVGQKLDRDTYDQLVPQLRERLLDVQFRLKSADFSVVIVIGGVEGAGKGETVNLLMEWLDTRGVAVHALAPQGHRTQEHPGLYRFWRELPPKGKIAIFFGSWYTRPIVDYVFRRSDELRFDRELSRIVDFELMLSNEGTLLLKFRLHISKKQQRHRLKKLKSSSRTAWRVTRNDWKFHAMYDHFRPVCSRALERTSTGHALWNIIEAADRRFRHATTAQRIVSAIEERLNRKPALPQPAAALPVPPRVNVIHSLDLRRKPDEQKYSDKLDKHQASLGHLARQLGGANRAVVVVFEGPDAAGKGGCIRRIVQALDARFYRVLPIAAPTDEERARPYLWRFWRHLPGRGHVAIYDRSWYGRVLVERIEELCTPNDWQRAYAEINSFEEQLVDSGIVLVKFWLAISPEEQLRRFQEREATGYKRYKLTGEDLRNREKWPAYEAAACEMFANTSTETAPWTLVEAEDKHYARVKVLKTLVDRVKSALNCDPKCHLKRRPK